MNDVAESPTDLNLSGSSIDENSPEGAVVGTFSTTDPDEGDTFTYQLVSGVGADDNAAFIIVENLLINSSSDFETQSSYSIRVQTTDSTGNRYEEVFTIDVKDVLEVAAPIVGQDNRNDRLQGTPNGEQLLGLGGKDWLFGKKGDDTLFGGEGSDRLYGKDGNDYLIGGDGSDRLYEDRGFDTLIGGDGSDRLYGGSQADLFVLESGRGRDTIIDFEYGTDSIWLAAGGLSFDDLAIVSQGRDTLINSFAGETLATLQRIDENLINVDDFTVVN